MSRNGDPLEYRRKRLKRQERGKKLTDLPEVATPAEADDPENVDEENTLLKQEPLRPPETIGQAIYGLFSTRTKQTAHFATYE